MGKKISLIEELDNVKKELDELSYERIRDVTVTSLEETLKNKKSQLLASSKMKKLLGIYIGVFVFIVSALFSINFFRDEQIKIGLLVLIAGIIFSGLIIFVGIADAINVIKNGIPKIIYDLCDISLLVTINNNVDKLLGNKSSDEILNLSKSEMNVVPKNKSQVSKIVENNDVICPSCGAKFPRGTKYCGRCGYTF